MAASALALGGVLAGTGAPAGAVRSSGISPYTEYVRARIADQAGLSDMAAARYGAALSASPGDPLIAGRAYRQALVAGDEALALKSAAMLDGNAALPPDGPFLFLGQQIRQKNWVAARGTINRIEHEQSFGLLVPILRAWVAQGAGDANPMAELAKGNPGALASVYATEHRAFLLLAMGKPRDAVTVLKASSAIGQGRDIALRLRAAESLSAKSDRAGALALLGGTDPAIVALRERITAGKRVSGPAVDAAFGYSQLMLRVAVDINREKVTPLSIALVRIATFAAPKNTSAWLSASQFLALAERYDAAAEALSHIPDTDVLASTARIARVRILLAKSDKAEALAAALAITARRDATAVDWTLLGDIYNGLDRYADAASAYGRAINFIGANAKDDERLWTLWLLKGSALDQAGSWPEAKDALEQARALGPDQAVVLNYLGYAQLERRQNMKEARALIEQANTLRPDDPAITDSLGWAHYLEGDYATAISKLETAVEGDPGGSEINEHLGDAYWSAGRRIEARYAWRAALVTADAKTSPRISRKIDFGLDTGDGAP